MTHFDDSRVVAATSFLPIKLRPGDTLSMEWTVDIRSDTPLTVCSAEVVEEENGYHVIINGRPPVSAEDIESFLSLLGRVQEDTHG